MGKPLISPAPRSTVVGNVGGPAGQPVVWRSEWLDFIVGAMVERMGGINGKSNTELAAEIAAAAARAEEAYQLALSAGGSDWRSAVVDFGDAYTSTAEFTVTDPEVSSSSWVEAMVSGGDSTSDNDEEDHQFASMFMRLASAPADGEFKLLATSDTGYFKGTMKIRYKVGE